ncbi:GAD-like domain protein (plasmid) [Caballeronia sp. SBC1]|uniref:GAD-like domain-containing protein n=1 Tax=unclassified Caballeronia TaxID=2646786 RepID=UPI0013E173FE|nr:MULTISPECIES: GAD-like domain-containing protein [unclassified Caballeronia]QIE25977.1 GAD-like domain protein [Caballeronia sp. SBC2]QIN64710.1 GAD-like domain protein [Caballeronia sp. SBC1]
MKDSFFEMFEEQFGTATSSVPVPEESLRKFKGVLPDKLLDHWRNFGWSCYAEGLFWTVDPDSYEDLADIWLEDTPFEEIDRYHVIARTGFGDLFLWGERTGPKVTIACAVHAIVAMEQDVRSKLDDPEQEIGIFFAGLQRTECDLKDQGRKSLFAQAIKTLGSLNSTEVYGFEPALIAGGRMTVNHLKKVNLDVHLRLLRQLAPPKIPFTQTQL